MSNPRLTMACCAALVATAAACAPAPAPTESGSSGRDALVGVWRSQIRFADGAFAPMQDLEFTYAYNAGGTMTESSNYDGAPPVPPAYGVWKKTGPNRYETKYVFYVTKPPPSLDELTKGSGWGPAGYGIFTESITLAEDGKSYKATIGYTQFDPSGKVAEGGGKGTASGTRFDF